MPRVVDEAQLDSDVSGLVDWVTTTHESVVVERDGVATYVIVPADDFARLEALEKREDRAEALASLRNLRKTIGDRNRDLSEDEAMSLADQIVREAVDSMIEKGILRYEDERDPT